MDFFFSCVERNRERKTDGSTRGQRRGAEGDLLRLLLLKRLLQATAAAAGRPATHLPIHDERQRLLHVNVCVF